MATHNDDTPSIQEIAELTARLRRLSAAGRDADPAERAAFLADKDVLIARIEAATRRADTRDEEGRSDGASEAGRWGRDDRSDGTDTAADDVADDAADDGEGWSR